MLLLALPLALVACDGSQKKAQEDVNSGNAQIAVYNGHLQWIGEHLHGKEIDDMNHAELRELKSHLDGLIASGSSALFYADQANVSFEGNADEQKEKIRTTIVNARHLKQQVEWRVHRVMN